MSILVGMWRSLWRFHRVMAGILVLEYALTFAILLMIFGVLERRASAISETSGVEERGLYVLQATGANGPMHRSEWLEAEQRFAALVGKEHVAAGSGVPFYGSGSEIASVGVPGASSEASLVQADGYKGDAQFASVLGLTLLRGSLFHTDEVVRRFGDDSPLVVLSDGLARHLFHRENAVGRQVNIAGKTRTVIGVVEALAAPNYLGEQRTAYTFLLPKLPGNGQLLLIRHGGAPDGLREVLAGLSRHDEGKVMWVLRAYTDIRSSYFRSDRLVVAVLAVVVAVVLLVALCGVLGLTNYWVARRCRQIAIRRALGARKADIVRHFLGESVLLVMLGVVCGVLLYILAGVWIVAFHAQLSLATCLASAAWLLSLGMVVALASVRRWLRMDPVALMRAA